MTIRITAVPRSGAPNSGYHPMFFAARRNDLVWMIPGKGEYIGDYQNVTPVWCDLPPFRSLFSVRMMRIIALLVFFVRAVQLPRQVFLVHSFIFCIPLWAARQNYALFIHGTDKRYLNNFIGSFFARKAIAAFGIGFKIENNKNVKVDELPNVFFLSAYQDFLNVKENIHDVLFVLRNALVKNPKYPYKLFINTPNDYLRIGVIGLDVDYLSSDENDMVRSNTNAGHTIKFYGRCSFSEVLKLMKGSNVLILPSYSEGVAKAMLEAFSMGMHVIVSINLKVPAVFEDFIIRTDLEDWQGVISKINECKRLGFNTYNLEFAEKYLKDSIDMLDKIYWDLTNNDFFPN